MSSAAGSLPAASAGPDAGELRLRALIARVAGHDEAALGELYDLTHGRVHGIALRITRRREVAEEVTEDAYWQVWRQALRFDPARGNAMAWLLTIARSRALDTLRRADPAEVHPEPETLADAAFGFGLLHGFGFAGALAELGLPSGSLARRLPAAPSAAPR